MNNFNILNYLEKRQHGYNGFKNNVNDILIEQLGYFPKLNKNNTKTDIGNTFACKFSRNKNNLHIIGCSSEHGEIIIKNTLDSFDSPNNQFQRNVLHDNAIFNFAWSDVEMKLVTACGDQTSKLCSLDPSGKLVEEREFLYGSSVKSVMFCPQSSNIFCGACQDSSIKIWDSRLNNSKVVTQFEHHIPNSHGIYIKKITRRTRPTRPFPASCVIFKNDQSVLSCAAMDNVIKLWDLRKSYRQVQGIVEPLPLLKYNINSNLKRKDYVPRTSIVGYVDMICDAQCTRLYASGTNRVIYCYNLEESSILRPISQFSGHRPETFYSKISLSHDGRYLFTGCLYNSGVIWFTGFPYYEEPVFAISNATKVTGFYVKELSNSDWCLDSSSLKLATSADSLPKIWSIVPSEKKDLIKRKFSKTPFYKSKLSSKMRTIPIKLESKLKEQDNNEPEKCMEILDCEKPNVENIQQTNSINPWEMLFSYKPLSSTQTSQTNNTTSNNSPVTSNSGHQVTSSVSSRKRKIRPEASNSRIDQFFFPHDKQKN